MLVIGLRQKSHSNFVPPADAQLWCVFRSSFAPSKGGLCCKLTTSRVGPLLIQVFVIPCSSVKVLILVAFGYSFVATAPPVILHIPKAIRRDRRVTHAIHVTTVLDGLLRARSTHRDCASCALPEHTNSVPAIVFNHMAVAYFCDKLAHNVPVLHSM